MSMTSEWPQIDSRSLNLRCVDPVREHYRLTGMDQHGTLWILANSVSLAEAEAVKAHYLTNSRLVAQRHAMKEYRSS